MKKIKAMLIHLLGGVTETESLNRTFEMTKLYEYRRVRLIRTYLDLLNGKDADTWCKEAYNYIIRIEEDTCKKITPAFLTEVEKNIPELYNETTNKD